MRLFVDTSALLALSRPADQHHEEAVKLAGRHIASGGGYLGTTLILSELYSHLLYLRGAGEASTALARLLDDPIHQWVDVTEELVRESLAAWLATYPDQSFSLVDAVSFEVMRRRRLTVAFAFDRHFEIAGYTLFRYEG